MSPRKYSLGKVSSSSSVVRGGSRFEKERVLMLPVMPNEILPIDVLVRPEIEIEHVLTMLPFDNL